MSRIRQARPSPPLMVAVLALVAALAGTAVAEQAGTSAKPVSKKKVKKIAVKQIDRLAPGLSVAHAATADDATNATNARTADNADNAETADNANSATNATRASSATQADGPFAYARVDDAGAVNLIESQSKGITESMVSDPGTDGRLCFDVPFSFTGAQVTIDYEFGSDDFAQFVAGNNGCPPGTDATVISQDHTGMKVDSAFYIMFYR